MARLMMSSEVLRGFAKLPAQVQKRLSEFVPLFEEDPHSPQVRLHPLKESMADPKVRGADLPNGYRAIIIAPEKGDTYALVYVDKHDDAYGWARNKRFEAHTATGKFQVFDVEQVQQQIQTQPQFRQREPDYALARLSDEELFQAGVPHALIPAVKAVRSDSALDALAPYLPSDCRDVLTGIAAGMTLDESLEEMIGFDKREVSDALPESPGDFSALDKVPNFGLVLVEGEEHLRNILQAPLDAWRVFLHPCQRKLVQWDARGPVNISGSAGTGKTVALLHRAVHLARALTDPRARVLVTTFTTTLAVTIGQHVKSLAPDVANRIEVVNLHALARAVCSRAGWRGKIAEDDDIQAVWDEVFAARGKTELPIAADEIKREFALVIDPNGIDEEEAYLTTVRTGRSPLRRPERRRVWEVVSAFLVRMRQRNLITFDGAVHQARLAVEQGKFDGFAHVLVDEVQDFCLEALRLIRALAPTGDGVMNPLTLAGDGHQRIYPARVPLSRAGIDVRGRSRRLKVNYRTSDQIRQYAHRLLAGLTLENPDGEPASTKGDRSAFEGPAPVVKTCGNEKEEARVIVAWIKDLLDNHGLGSHEICVTPTRNTIVSALAAENIPTYLLRPREADPGSNVPGVRLGTRKRIKGLEFRAIAMACAAEHDPMNRLADATVQERCELYVAATRAREYLLVMASKGSEH